MDRVIFMPSVTTQQVADPNRYSVAPAVVHNKLLRKIFNKVFDYMVKKGYICQRMMSEYVYDMKQVTIDLDKVDEQIAMNRAAIEAVYNKRIDTIIMGADIMRKIVQKDIYTMGQVHFQMDRASRYAMYGGMNPDMSPRYDHVEYCGLNVHMVPWFKGFLLLENKERY